MESAHDGQVKLINRNTVKNAHGDLIVMSRNMQVVVVDAEGKERQSFKLPFGARLQRRREVQGQARRSHRRMGSLRDADPHRSGGQGASSRT